MFLGLIFFYECPKMSAMTYLINYQETEDFTFNMTGFPANPLGLIYAAYGLHHLSVHVCELRALEVLKNSRRLDMLTPKTNFLKLCSSADHTGSSWVSQLLCLRMCVYKTKIHTSPTLKYFFTIFTIRSLINFEVLHQYVYIAGNLIISYK